MDNETLVMDSVVETAASGPAARTRNTTTPLRRFRPSISLGYQDKLYTLAHDLEKMNHDEVSLELSAVINAEDGRRSQYETLGLSRADILPTLKWTTALRVLRDLCIQGWTVQTDDEGLILRAPGTTESSNPEDEKEAIRRSFAFARNAQLQQASTIRFIRRVERRGIRKIFADGPELVGRLEAHGPAGVQPELELVESGARDSCTGLPLQDIWRYARHYWSIPYQSTPGRNIFYLVRDCAVEERPLIGIAALGNTVLGLAQRDHYAGWTSKGLRNRWAQLDSESRRRLAERLFQVVEEGIAETFSTDIWPEGIPSDWRVAVADAERIEGESSRKRRAASSGANGKRDDDYITVRAAHTAAQKGDMKSVDWDALARTNLYHRKRAGTLADLIRARGTLLEFGSPCSAAIERALETADGVRALETALRRIKQAVLSSNVMELITCGAVQPYRDLLGGKLVALLMMSRKVVDDYQSKYADQVSLIASGLAARPIVRPARLGWLTTSSLYAIGSSQYNRLKLSTESGDLTYRRIGVTQSFGTVHFSPETVTALNELARLANENRRRINNLFGEGTSPKMRLLRAGLETLGLDPNVFLRHHSPRLLYGANLCSNLSDLLIGLSEKPEYVLPSGSKSDSILIDHWRARWLARRIGREDVRTRIAAQRVDNFLLSRDAAVPRSDRLSDSGGNIAESEAPTDPLVSGKTDDSTFIERLYRNTNSYADRLKKDELEAIHVDLGVDAYLVEQAKQGKQVIVTGNPGDGKTHLIERLRPQLEALDAEVITDANAVSDKETIETWTRCREKKRPFVLAINEWPLYVLQRKARIRKFGPVKEALRQVQEARFFVDEKKPDPPADGVITIDLALRNLLTQSVIQAVLERLTEDRFYRNLNGEDPMLANREALMHPQIVGRLCKLLEAIGLRLGHFTMRQLVGFIAFLLSGGKDATDRLRSGQDASGLAYSNLAFEGGVGGLFETVRQVFDPVKITHPTFDEQLWRGKTNPDDWTVGDAPASCLMLPSDRVHGFRAAKRRFYFEHSDGCQLFDLYPKDEIEFEDVRRLGANDGGGGAADLVRELVLALNQFYEPDFSDQHSSRLLLWQSHRYDVRAPAAFVSLRDLQRKQLRIEVQRYADWVEAWLPSDQQDRRCFALVAKVDGEDRALLLIDRELFLTLREAQRGLGRSSWSRTTTRRITGFIDQLDRVFDAIDPEGVEDVRIRNVATDLDEEFFIQRQPSRFRI